MKEIEIDTSVGADNHSFRMIEAVGKFVNFRDGIEQVVPSQCNGLSEMTGLVPYRLRPFEPFGDAEIHATDLPVLP
ncbi:MAG TPA: hypothetical protein VMX16_10005 [Terriglobia bacterium]|nr:hypothetical protein [Terriglobia bacterium]